MHIRSVALIILLFASFQLSAQEYLMKFLEMNHDFGRVYEDGGAVTHRFILYNAGEKALEIIEVKASCGCTTPDWTKEKIMPGDSGFVEARFDPHGRPGPFDKSLNVFSNTSEGINTLKITGNVVKRPIGGEVPPAKYDKFFTYDKKVIQTTEERFVGFMDSLKVLAAAKRAVNIRIESSASFVPTHRYKSNEELARKRGEDTRDLVIAQAKKAGIDTDKLVFTIDSHVQGPKYHNDAQKRIKDYEKWQYVKVWAE